MATATLTIRYSGPGGNNEQSVSKTGTGGGVLIDGETVANSQTDVEIQMNLDVSACKAFYIVSDKDVTVETNSGSAPDDTLSLKANEPYFWHSTMLDAFLLGTDVTSIFVTNASGATATLYAFAVWDATP